MEITKLNGNAMGTRQNVTDGMRIQEVKMGIFLSWQEFRKKIMRREHLSTVMSMCRCSDM